MKNLLILLTFILLLNNAKVQSQTVISGHIKDTAGEAVFNISVLLHVAGSNLIMAYGFSDINGYYEINANITADSLDIKTNSSFYDKKMLRIANASQTIDFVLEETVYELKGVTVMARPIEKTNDTIEYFVDSFVGQEDKSIEDVLRKMPGIEIENNGQIIYQGLPIQKFYVDGMDLMDGKYAAISKNLPHQSVASVEIYENHQPIALLRDRVETERASLNIKLSKNVTVTGSGELGIGAYPFLWNANITPMLFSEKMQMVASLQSNNIGNDLLNNNMNYYSQNNEDHEPDANEELSIQTASPPMINKNRYLNNTTHHANFNILAPISETTQMRVNLSYINNLQKQNSSQLNTYFLPDDTISYTEKISNKIYDSYLKGDVAINRNDKKAYLNDKISFSKQWDKSYGYVLNNDESINQILNNNAMSVSNDMRVLFPVGKHLLDFVSYNSYDNLPESLNVEPGVFEEIFNVGKPYQKTSQHFNKERFFTNEALSGIFTFGNLIMSTKVGVSHYQNKVKTNLAIFPHENLPGYTSFANYVNHTYTKPYINTHLEYNLQKATFALNLPITLEHVTTDNQKEKQKLTKVFFNPILSFKYVFNSMFKLNAYGIYEQNIDNFEKFYDNFVLTNYQNLCAMTAPLSVSDMIRANVRLTFNQPFYSVNSNLSYTYQHRNSDYIYKYNIAENGASILQMVDSPNTTDYHIMNFNVKKFIPAIKTTIGVKANFSHIRRHNILNGVMTENSNLTSGVSPNAIISISHWAHLNYSLNFNNIKSFSDNIKQSDLNYIRHYLSLGIFPHRDHLISFDSEIYSHQGKEYVYFDVLYQYSIPKHRLDFELKCTNIFNNKSYVSYYSGAFSIVESIYEIRPIEIFCSVKFRF